MNFNNNHTVNATSQPPPGVPQPLPIVTRNPTEATYILYVMIGQFSIYDNIMNYPNYTSFYNLRSPLFVKIGRSSTNQNTFHLGNNDNRFHARLNNLASGGPFVTEPLFLWSLEGFRNTARHTGLPTTTGNGNDMTALEDAIRNLGTATFGAVNMNNEWIAFDSILKFNKFICHVTLRLMYTTGRNFDSTSVFGHGTIWPMVTIIGSDYANYNNNNLPTPLIQDPGNIAIQAINIIRGNIGLSNIQLLGWFDINNLVEIITRMYEIHSGRQDKYPLTPSLLLTYLQSLGGNIL